MERLLLRLMCLNRCQTTLGKCLFIRNRKTQNNVPFSDFYFNDPGRACTCRVPSWSGRSMLLYGIDVLKIGKIHKKRAAMEVVVNLHLQLPKVFRGVFLKNTSWLLLLDFTGIFELENVFLLLLSIFHFSFSFFLCATTLFYTSFH